MENLETRVEYNLGPRPDGLPVSLDLMNDSSFSESSQARFYEEELPQIANQIRVARWSPIDSLNEIGTMERKVLSVKEEKNLFLYFNYSKHQYNQMSREGASSEQLAQCYKRVLETRSKITEANMALVLAMAKNTKIPNMEFSELLSEGNMALLRAIEKFDVSRGFKFSTYACRAILKSFNRLATKTGRYRKIFPVEFDPDLEEDNFADEKHTYQHSVFIDDLRETIENNYAGLNDLERTVLTRRFDLDRTGTTKTLTQIGEIVGLSQERVRQLQNLALEKLRECLAAPSYDKKAKIKVVRTINPITVQLAEQYQQYLLGKRNFNPLVHLNMESLPVIKKALGQILNEGEGCPGISTTIHKMGFRTLLLHTGGTGRLIKAMAPRKVHRFPFVRKWVYPDSYKFALNKIRDALYDIPDYRSAELEGNRDKQIRIMNRFLETTTSLSDFFNERQLGGMMIQFIDPTGVRGLKKINSPKAVLEFYDSKKKLGWFDRTQKTYVHHWRIRENHMWDKGEESVTLGLEAIADVLFEIEGYREAEEKRERRDQLALINELINKGDLNTHFMSRGLTGLMKNLVDPAGKIGIKKYCSALGVLEFYSERKNLKWFDTTLPEYIHFWKIPERGRWKNPEDSRKTAAEFIDAVLNLVPGYRDAKSSGDRAAQMRILGESISRSGGIFNFIGNNGLNGLISARNLVNMGKNYNSPTDLFRFYSEMNNLEWFNKNLSPYLSTDGERRLVVVDRTK